MNSANYAKNEARNQGMRSVNWYRIAGTFVAMILITVIAGLVVREVVEAGTQETEFSATITIGSETVMLTQFAADQYAEAKAEADRQAAETGGTSRVIIGLMTEPGVPEDIEVSALGPNGAELYNKIIINADE